MLSLVSSQDEMIEQSIDDHINDHAPALALSSLAVISGNSQYRSLQTTCTEHLNLWWQLSGTFRSVCLSASSPKDSYEQAYWYLLHLLESLDEHQLLGSNYVQLKVSTAAAFLLGFGQYYPHMLGVRP